MATYTPGTVRKMDDILRTLHKTPTVTATISYEIADIIAQIDGKPRPQKTIHTPDED